MPIAPPPDEQRPDGQRPDGQRPDADAASAPDGTRSPTPAPPASVDAIVLAGGRGLRMGASVNKVWLEVEGRPLIAWPLRVLAAEPRIRDLYLVAGEQDLSSARSLVADLAMPGLAPPVRGGATRPASERAGLAALRPGAGYVLIHDGARPCLDPGLVARVCDAAHRVGGAVPVLDFTETVVGRDAGGHVVTVDDVLPPHTPRGSELQRVQTPQVFDRAPLLAAYEAAASAGFSGLDTADTVQRFSDLSIAAVAGDPHNIKVTYPADLERIAAALRTAGGGV